MDNENGRKISIQKQENDRLKINTSSNFSKFWVSNSSLTSGINAASIWYSLSHSTPLKNRWAWSGMQHKDKLNIEI